MADLQWTDLIIDRNAAPRELNQEEFREWMRRRPIFVSSPIDDEMNRDRMAVRDWLYSIGAEPVMWEEITPQDRHATDAYLEGVDRSDLLVLMLGSRYGVADATGYSATHKESERGKGRDIPRLLFEKSGLRPSERDGKLNDWIGALRHEVSGAKYGDCNDLVRLLERRLRELAGAQETPWIKLGPIVVPGSIRQRSNRDDTELIATIRTKDSTLSRALSELTGHRSQVLADRLTWSTETYPVRVEEVETHSVSTSTTEHIVVCRLLADRIETPMHVSFSMGHDRSVGPAEQAGIWVRRSIFGETLDPMYGDSLDYFTAPNVSPLPRILDSLRAQAWLAEGLTRLYLVEGLVTTYGGHFERLIVGPASASSLRVEGLFRLGDYERSPAKFSGAVPLP